MGKRIFDKGGSGRPGRAAGLGALAPAACLVLILVLAGPGLGQELSFVARDEPPYVTLTGSAPTGWAVEVINLACARAGLYCPVAVLPWRRAVRHLRTGRADAIVMVSRSNQELGSVSLSPSLAVAEYGFFFKGAAPASLSGAVVGVYGPSEASRLLRRLAEDIPGLAVDLTPDDTSAFRKLAAGRIQAVFSDRAVGLALLERLDITTVVYAGARATEHRHIAFNRLQSDPEAVRRFMRALEEMKSEGLLPDLSGNGRVQRP